MTDNFVTTREKRSIQWTIIPYETGSLYEIYLKSKRYEALVQKQETHFSEVGTTQQRFHRFREDVGFCSADCIDVNPIHSRGLRPQNEFTSLHRDESLRLRRLSPGDPCSR